MLTFTFVGHASTEKSDSQHSTQQATNETVNVSEVLKSAKDVFEGPEEEFKNIQDRLKAWLEAFNFNSLLHEAHRWTLVQKEKSPKVAEHALNIAFLFPATHVLEMASGPLSAMLNEVLGGPEWLSGTLLLAGTSISFPGFDPLFIVAVIAYKNVGFQKFVTKVRVGVFKASQFAYKYSGLSHLTNALVETYNPIDNLKRATWFTLINNNDELKLKSLVLPANADSADWDRILLEAKTLGWNIHGLVKQLKKQMQSSLDTETNNDSTSSKAQTHIPHYINSMQKTFNEDSEVLIVELNPLAFPINVERRFRALCMLNF